MNFWQLPKKVLDIAKNRSIIPTMFSKIVIIKRLNCMCLGRGLL